MAPASKTCSSEDALRLSTSVNNVQKSQSLIKLILGKREV